VRVVTWNIRFGIEFADAARVLRDHPALADADIVLLQEMDEIGTAAIADAIGANWVYYAAAAHHTTSRGFGNAVLSRWPITGAAEIPLPHSALIRGQPRSATRACVVVEGREVLTYSAHTEIRSMRLARRVQQFATIAADAGTHSAPLAVIGGDFNTATARDITTLGDEMHRADLVHMSATAGPTFRRFNRDFCLDHVFARGLTASAAGKVSQVTASDHLPLWVELRETPRD